MVQRCKTALGSYDFVIKHISGVKNIVADYLSRLVKNFMIEEIRKDNELIGINDGGIETTVSKLAKGYTPWTYMRLHVR